MGDWVKYTRSGRRRETFHFGGDKKSKTPGTISKSNRAMGKPSSWTVSSFNKGSGKSWKTTYSKWPGMSGVRKRTREAEYRPSASGWSHRERQPKSTASSLGKALGWFFAGRASRGGKEKVYPLYPNKPPPPNEPPEEPYIPPSPEDLSPSNKMVYNQIQRPDAKADWNLVDQGYRNHLKQRSLSDIMLRHTAKRVQKDLVTHKFEKTHPWLSKMLPGYPTSDVKQNLERMAVSKTVDKMKLRHPKLVQKIIAKEIGRAFGPPEEE